jgi:hypothetical protein
VSPEDIQEILKICEASNADANGFRELPQKTTLTLYLSKNSVGLTVSGIEAIAVRGHHAQARTQKGDLYVVSLDDVFAANIEGRAQSKSARRAGFAAG